MRKVIGGAVLALVFTGAGGTAAFAGEVGGNGEATPIKTRYVAASACAFNGLDDGSESGNPVTPGVVQSVGPLIAELAKSPLPRSTFTQIIREEGPGTNCRGNLEGEE
jgi:hypothetical protein